MAQQDLGPGLGLAAIALLAVGGVLMVTRKAKAIVAVTPLPMPEAAPSTPGLTDQGVSPETQAIRQALDPFTAAVEDNAATWGVDPDLLRAVVWRESRGNPDATGDLQDPRGPALGLGQVLLQTARGMGFPGNPSELYDPQVNLYYAAQYLRSRLDVYGGDVPSAVAAYNAGTARYAGRQFVNQPYVDAVLLNYDVLTGAAVA
jgi:soluble lytic murein transglycosylase-like protein